MTIFTLLLRFSFLLSAVSSAFVHPGLMITSTDISRIKTKLSEKKEPWTSSYAGLTGTYASQLTYTNNATSNLTRSVNGALLWHDTAAAFSLALRWTLEGGDQYADAAVKILTAWADTLESLGTDPDAYLNSGFQGFELANAGELLRDYAPFVANGQKAFTKMMVDIFLHDAVYFIEHKDPSEHVHNHFFASWELCNMASAMAIAILTDDQDTYDFVLNYWHTGDGNGAIALAISDIVEEPGTGKPLGQGQEVGRDQGHASLDQDQQANIAQMAWNQGTDLYADSEYRMLRGAEYFARFNLGYDVPFVRYTNVIADYTEASTDGRGAVRPGWELLYKHYAQVKGMDVPWIKKYLNYTLASSKGGYEGGIGSLGGNEDSLGWGSLLHHLDDEDVAALTTQSAVSTSTSSGIALSTKNHVSTSASSSLAVATKSSVITSTSSSLTLPSTSSTSSAFAIAYTSLTSSASNKAAASASLSASSQAVSQAASPVAFQSSSPPASQSTSQPASRSASQYGEEHPSTSTTVSSLPSIANQQTPTASVSAAPSKLPTSHPTLISTTLRTIFARPTRKPTASDIPVHVIPKPHHNHGIHKNLEHDGKHDFCT
ncbi:chondroitin AC/alginate lyase [Lophium mytilinum]|uniref:Chondroitin AC/alginate lyase n=1 Tax=Lophium mytilinum TaxID=390894 RepID=A0A6A6QBW6_9PEZI|nr:chondroitin AC/alginate lyase [Lophium mytilinum]